jgi:hypothetical protein
LIVSNDFLLSQNRARPHNPEGEPTHTGQAYTGPVSGNRRGVPGGQRHGTDYQTRLTEHDRRRKAHMLSALHGNDNFYAAMRCRFRCIRLLNVDDT